MMVIGLVVLARVFEVGFVLLIPIAFTVARRTKTSLVLLVFPCSQDSPWCMAGASASRGTDGRNHLSRRCRPHHFYALIVGLPTAIIGGPHLYQADCEAHRSSDGESNGRPVCRSWLDRRFPNFWITLLYHSFPCASHADRQLGRRSLRSKQRSQFLHCIGNDDWRLLIGVLLSFYTLGRMRGFNRATILRFSNECLAPTATITLLVGAGGGFGRILQDSGVSQAIISVAMQSHIPLLFLAWLLAASMRLATGSATVAMSTAAGIVAPIALHATGVRPELLAIATGAGSLIFSHVNDGGFWLVKEYFNMSVAQTMKTWSVCETIISVTALVLTIGLSLVI